MNVTCQAAGADVTGIELIALRPRTNMDVSLLVKVLSVEYILPMGYNIFCKMIRSWSKNVKEGRKNEKIVSRK